MFVLPNEYVNQGIRVESLHMCFADLEVSGCFPSDVRTFHGCEGWRSISFPCQEPKLY